MSIMIKQFKIGIGFCVHIALAAFNEVLNIPEH